MTLTMILTDNDGHKWVLKCPEKPQPSRWLWRDVWLGLGIALVMATQVFA